MTTDQADLFLDAANLACPLPLLKTKQALKTLTKGQLLVVAATDRGSLNDIPRYIGMTDHTLEEIQEQPDQCLFFIRK